VVNSSTTLKECPRDCGLCDAHKSHTALANVVITNRCDLACFYCFFYAKAMGYVYEPSLEQIRDMFRRLRSERPVATNALQLTGGEPCLRDDLIDIVRIAKEEGFEHIQVNTNGIRISREPELAARLRAAGVSHLYLSFDGVTARANPKNHWEIPRIMENCRKAGLSIVLVPTVIKEVNDGEVGEILRFAMKNNDIVRGVNYQPVSLVGRITRAEREKMRITIPDVIRGLEEQTGGMVAESDWYPVPSVSAVSNFAEAMAGKPQYELSAHPVCGMATYLFKDADTFVPITRFVDVEGFMKFLDKKAEEIKSGKNKLLAGAEILFKLKGFVDEKKQPRGLNLANVLINVLKDRNYDALGSFHRKSLFVGMMHFQDLYNYDVERVKRCCIHYAQPDGTIVPFCAFNVIPQWYRDKIQQKFSESIPDWEKRTGRKLSDDMYRRDAAALEAEPIYSSTYS
jgi:uncharacterized radical SAM superfamily Fe-S cluster-containing enzyme